MPRSTSAPPAIETWARIVEVHDRITQQVDSALHRGHGLSLTGFEALRRVATAPGESATMGELAEGLRLSRAGVTSTVGRLVAAGLVERVRSGGDRRLLHARLTPAGRELFPVAAATHDGLVEELIRPVGADAARVIGALTRVAASVPRVCRGSGRSRSDPGETSSP